jgi:hypothetical protein
MKEETLLRTGTKNGPCQRRALEFPESCQVYWNEYRKFIPRPFKFMVLYKVAHGMVVVSAVVDARMDPSLIRDRLRSR